MSEYKVVMEDKAVSKTYDEVVVSKRWQQYRSERYHEYRRQWNDNPVNAIVNDFPLHIDIEITNYCNLQCPMCPRTIMVNDNTFEPLAHMDFELFSKIVKEGAANGLSSVKFNYLGEPLMHPDVAKMVRFCKEQGLVDVAFNTNGVLLTDDMIVSLLEAGIDGIYISFDSDDKAQFESVRVGTTIERVEGNIRRLSEIRNGNEAYWKTQIRISKILFPDDTQEIIDHFIEKWTPYVDSIGLGALIDETKALPVEVREGVRCDQPWQRLFVSTAGLVFPCCMDSRKQYVLGDARRDSIKALWTGEKLTALREAHLAGCYHTIGICRNCRYILESGMRLVRTGEDHG